MTPRVKSLWGKFFLPSVSSHPKYGLCKLLPFSHLVVSDSLRLHGLQHAWPPCPLPSPGVCSNSCPLTPRSSHPTVSSSATLFLLLISIFPSIRVFSNELVLHMRRSKYWSFSFSISPSNENSRLISFRIDKRLCKLGNFIKIKVFHERGLIHVLFLLFLQNLLKWVLGIRQRNNEKGGKCVQAKVVSSLWPSKDPDSVMPKCSVGVFSHVRLFENPWIVVHQAPLPMGFPSQEYWGGFPCPPPGDLPDPGIEPESSASPASAGGFCFFYHWATKKTQIL